MRRFGEPGLVRFLAVRDGVSLRNLEPPIGEEVRRLLALYTAEQLKVYYVLRQIPQYAQSGAFEPLPEEAARVMDVLSARPGLAGPPRSLAELEASYARLLPPGADWRRAPAAWCLPTHRDPALYTVALSQTLTRLRDEHMVAFLRAELRAGQRVFAVVGASHVVMQERALRTPVADE